MKKDIWIAGIARGHNAAVCLLKNGEVVFSIEEERLTRKKYDGGPLACITKILEYTDRLDYLIISHTTSLESAGKIDYAREDVYSSLARKLKLIGFHEDKELVQVHDVSKLHHKMHALCAFYRSGFDSAAAVIVDGAGSMHTISDPIYDNTPVHAWEHESIYSIKFPYEVSLKYKHCSSRNAVVNGIITDFDSNVFDSHDDGKCIAVITDKGGIVKAYEGVTHILGWEAIEAGKTMGLFPYGQKNMLLPPCYETTSKLPGLLNRNLFSNYVPNGSWVNTLLYSVFDLNNDDAKIYDNDISKVQVYRDLAYAVQTQSQAEMIKLIRNAVLLTKEKNVVISGGYGLNCVANYEYLDALKDKGINIYVEPVSSDAGTAIGAALFGWYYLANGKEKHKDGKTLYLGPKYNYSKDQIQAVAEKYEGKISDASYDDVVSLLRDKNIVTIFQGGCEAGPRALGNRSILFDPTFEDGKDFVNTVKRREYFRPFAGTILKEHVHDWFDLRGMEESPFMMYAVNCKPGVAQKIPSIIHVDKTCRIQTVTKEQNEHFYNLIETFYKKTGVPVLFNTSFNLGGEPLVETLDDAVSTLSRSDIEYLFLPEYGKLITVKNVVSEKP